MMCFKLPIVSKIKSENRPHTIVLVFAIWRPLCEMEVAKAKINKGEQRKQKPTQESKEALQTSLVVYGSNRSFKVRIKQSMINSFLRYSNLFY